MRLLTSKMPISITPSKYIAEERNIAINCKHCRKQLNVGILKDDRVEKFKKLLELSSQYKQKSV